MSLLLPLRRRIPLLRLLAFGLIQGILFFNVLGYLRRASDNPTRSISVPQPPLQQQEQQETHYLRTTTTSSLEIDSPPQQQQQQPEEPQQEDAVTSLQMDIMVPASGADDQLKIFAQRLGKTIASYTATTTTTTTPTSKNSELTITIFRLLVTRFTPDEITTSKQLQQELSQLSGLPLQRVVMVPSTKQQQQFSRSRAMNLLHQHACHLTTCLITRMDVDMDIKQQFFISAIQDVYLEQTITTPPPFNAKQAKQWQQVRDSMNHTDGVAYFPIVWSSYNPKSIQLVQKHLGRQGKQTLPDYSEHKGHWRDRGTGMYVLRGSDATKFQFDEEKFQGWGGEDGDFYAHVAKSRRIVRKNEPGLIHVWHPKACTVGSNDLTESQLKSCRYARNGEEGSALGIQLLRKYGLWHPTA